MNKSCGHDSQCNCSRVLLEIPIANKANIEQFEKEKEFIKKEVEILDRKHKPLCHLHLHTEFSTLDGISSADDYIKLAKEYGHKNMAITDHGNLSGTFDFWKKCKAAGIKPIIGMEAYVNNTMGDFEEKKYEGGNSHQSILVMNHKGFVNINKLAYKSYTEGFYGRGRIKTDWLFEHKEGLFITTSCSSNLMARLVFEGKEKEAEDYLIILIREFGDNIAAELQFNEFDITDKNGIHKSQKIYNAWILKMTKKYSLMPILTNDVHYALPGDVKLQDTLLAVSRKEHLSTSWKLDTRNLFYANADDFHILNKKLGFNYPESFIDRCLENTLKVAEKCTYDFDIKIEKYPRYEATPDVIEYFKTNDTKEIITKLAFGKLKKKLKEYKENKIVDITPEKEKEYHDRLLYELQVISEKDTLDYFMVYWELIRDYKSRGNVVGPGRGSAAGSLLSFCLDITSIDPVRFCLYFERFLNPSRKGLPDIDCDIMADTDNDIEDFLYKKYGKERVLRVITFLTFQERGSLKDVARAHLGEEYTGRNSDVEAVAKEMPDFSKVEYSLRDWFMNWPKDPACSDVVRSWIANTANKIIIEETIGLKGKVRGVGQHAAGIVITPGPCWEYLPTNIVSKQKTIVTAFPEADKSGKDLSELKILKLDILKLETLNVIQEAIDIIKDKKGIDVTEAVKNVNLNDKNLYFEFRLGMNHGIFQFESSGMGALIRGINCESFDEVVATVSLYRPGPLGIGAHKEYIENKFNPECIKYVHPALESVLKDTNGVLIFQEQLMFIANKIGGMSLGEGDMLRRYMDKASAAIAKKSAGQELSIKETANHVEFDKYWNIFLDGAEKNGYKKEEVDVIKNWIIKYLGYGFNKSHALSYSYLAMQTLFLKHYYPTEFYTALLNHPKDSGDKDKVKAWIAAAIASAISKGIKITSPSTKSGYNWTMTGDKEISIGFSGINGLGDIAYAELKSFIANKKKPLSEFSLVEFFELPFSKFNKTAFESCLKAGVFDEWSDSRSFLLSLKEKKRKKAVANQGFLFDLGGPEFDIKLDTHNFSKTTPEEKRAGFLEVCNFDLEKIEKITTVKTEINKKSKRPIDNILSFEDNDWYFFILEGLQEALTKNGKPYLVLKVGDGIGHMNLRVFSPMAEKLKPDLEVGSVFVAKFEKNDGGFVNFQRNTKFKKFQL